MSRNAVTKSEKVAVPNSTKKRTVFSYPNGMHLESDIDKLASFHRVSHKNMAHLKKICRAAGAKVFRPPHVFPTRWVTSSYRATHSVDVHWPLLIKHCWNKNRCPFCGLFLLKLCENQNQINYFSIICNAESHYHTFG